MLAEVAACQICAGRLPHAPRPVVQVSETARLLIAGQAPGRRVHATGLPFNDPSGDTLRRWMGVDRETFYDASKIAILPMGFCYPGTGRSGDLPPRPECAPAWRQAFLDRMPQIVLTLVIGQYAHAWHLGSGTGTRLAETVGNWRMFWPEILPMPHPSPRNRLWLRKNAFFEAEVVPALRARVSAILGT